MTDDAMGFHPKWVAPYYLKLMNGNFLRLSSDEQQAFIHDVRQVLEEIDSATLGNMLSSSNWRPRLTAGWFIGFQKRQEFAGTVSEHLLKFPNYGGMYCVALARIGDANAADGLEAYLDEYLKPDHARNWDAEKLTVQYGLAGLEWVSAERSKAFYPVRWNEFVEALFDFYTDDRQDDLSKSFRAAWQFDTVKSTFKQWMDFAAVHFD